MFKFWTVTKNGKEQANYEGSFNYKYDEVVGALLRKEITEKVANAWIDKYGAELIESIAPQAVNEAVKRHIAQKLMGDK